MVRRVLVYALYCTASWSPSTSRSLFPHLKGRVAVVSLVLRTCSWDEHCTHEVVIVYHLHSTPLLG